MRVRSCESHAYTFPDSATDEPGKFDELVEGPLGVKVLVDNKALMHVVGTRMDFVTDRLRRVRCARCHTWPPLTPFPQVRVRLRESKRQGSVRLWRVFHDGVRQGPDSVLPGLACATCQPAPLLSPTRVSLTAPSSLVFCSAPPAVCATLCPEVAALKVD
jgi:hypothetical protein